MYILKIIKATFNMSIMTLYIILLYKKFKFCAKSDCFIRICLAVTPYQNGDCSIRIYLKALAIEHIIFFSQTLPIMLSCF